MAEKNLTYPSAIVKKSNVLCRAVVPSGTVWEARLLAIVASKIQQDDKDFHTYEIPFSEIFGKHKDGRTYKLIDLATDKAMLRVIKIQEGKGLAKYNVFSKCVISPKRGYLTAQIHPDLKPHYLQLKERFTKHSLSEFLNLPSTYSQRIFEILKSWDEAPETTIPLADLHVILDVPKSLKANFKDFRRYVLEKAHKDISKHTSLSYEWKAIAKDGKPVTRGIATVAIKFIFSKPRIEKKKIEDKQIEKSEKQKRNNKIALAALSCLEKEGGDCKEDLGKDECGFCRSSLQV